MAPVDDFVDVVLPQFWTTKEADPFSGPRDPKLQFRFKVVIPGFALEDIRPKEGDIFADDQDGENGVAWYAKSIDKPGMTIVDPNKGQYATQFFPLNPSPKVSNPQYKEISMVLVDPYYPNTTRKIARLFRRGGLNEDQARRIIFNKYGPGQDALVSSFLDTIGEVQIFQLDHKGNELEKWTLYNAYPSSVDFGKLDYSSDGLVEISMTWYYSNFKVEFPKVGREQYYDYFADGNNVNPEQSKPTEGKIRSNCESIYGSMYSGVSQDLRPNFEDWLAEGNCPGYTATGNVIESGTSGAEENYTTRENVRGAVTTEEFEAEAAAQQSLPFVVNSDSDFTF